MIKKMGVVTVGVAAGLMAAAPFASATESHGGHEGHHGHHGDSGSCNVVGGEAGAEGGNSGNALIGNLVAQVPVGGNNALNLTCNKILNDNLSHNDVALSILGDSVVK